ncbi:MAG: 6-phospho-3-hexuloisomerase [Nocardioides marinisabuli]|uniref:6-phospho-3-hexuloisomerase n=1 Tax=Nocardioides marinisabuli TaxID=419476 RepID=UPI00321AA2E6
MSAIGRVVEEVAGVLAEVDQDAFDRLVAVLQEPGRTWFCTGQGRSGLVARMAAMRLVHLGHRAHVVGEATAPSISAEDALLVLSASGTTTVSRHHAETARGVGAAVALVTTAGPSPLRSLADVTLDVPVSASAQFGGSLFEQAALLTLDAAVLAIDAGDPASREEMHRRHANLQ